MAVTIPLAGKYEGCIQAALFADGSKLLVCNMSERLVNVIDTADPHGKQQVLTVGKDPMGFAFAPDGKTVLVANHGDGTVSVIDLSQNRVVSSFYGRRGRRIAGLLLERLGDFALRTHECTTLASASVRTSVPRRTLPVRLSPLAQLRPRRSHINAQPDHRDARRRPLPAA